MIVQQLKDVYDKLYDIYDLVNPSVFRNPALGMDVENKVGDLLEEMREIMNSIEEDI